MFKQKDLLKRNFGVKPSIPLLDPLIQEQKNSLPKKNQTPLLKNLPQKCWFASLFAKYYHLKVFFHFISSSETLLIFRSPQILP
jgi:hypothetical protein